MDPVEGRRRWWMSGTGEKEEVTGLCNTWKTMILRNEGFFIEPRTDGPKQEEKTLHLRKPIP